MGLFVRCVCAFCLNLGYLHATYDLNVLFECRDVIILRFSRLASRIQDSEVLSIPTRIAAQKIINVVANVSTTML